MNPIVLIPARMASTRLPGKPLADVGGVPMIVAVLERAQEAGFVRIAVAAAEQEICDAVIAAGGEAVLTNPAHPSGSDRIFEALQALDPNGAHDAIINLQGDLPTLEPEAIRAVAAALEISGANIATLVAPCAEDDRDNPNVVKAVVSLAEGKTIGRALYFTRASAPHGDGPLWHHIGIYAYTRAALTKFVALPPSPLELREKLEQLRALEAGMSIAVAIAGGVPLGVDTPQDLEKARAVLAARKGQSI
jgi:3-deoxy-manno-octulosonate cytidylyltransferase (CMP-KDO synthetase)